MIKTALTTALLSISGRSAIPFGFFFKVEFCFWNHDFFVWEIGIFRLVKNRFNQKVV